MPRTAIPNDVRVQVLTEAGYRCAIPTCRCPTVELHHIEPVRNGGLNTSDNLIALCPTCHTRYEKGEIAGESIAVWKTTLVALSHALDKESIDNLLFLHRVEQIITKKLSAISNVDENVLIQKNEESGITEYHLRFPTAITSLNFLVFSGDGVLKFTHLIAAGLAGYYVTSDYNSIEKYTVALTNKGKRIVEAWLSGNRVAVKEALGDLSQE